MNRLPPVATLLVALAVLAMIALGVWQLERKSEKERLIALYERNRAMSSTVIFPVHAPPPANSLFRHSSVMCLEPMQIGWRAGRTADGASGYRAVAACRTGAEGPGVMVDLGVAARPGKIGWKGGPVSGTIVPGLDQPDLLDRLTRKAVPVAAMLVADQSPAGLKASAPPSPENVPNNHLAYALQWFFFAGAAAVIYALAVRRKIADRRDDAR